MRSAAPALALSLALVACTDDLAKPELVADLRILGVRSDPAEATAGTRVALSSLVVHPDPAAEIERVWFACPTADQVEACLESPQLLGSGATAAYTLPEGTDAPALLVLVAALGAEGGLDGCLDAFERDGVVAEFCRIAVKRVRVLRDGDTPNANPALQDLTVDGSTVRVSLAPGSIEQIEDGAESPFLSWFVTSGELDHFRTDGDDEGLENQWTPPDEPGRIWVVVRDGRGGEGWIVGERSPPR